MTGNRDRAWRVVHEVRIKHRALENVNETLRMASDLLSDYMGEQRHPATMALIRELDALQQDTY